MFDNFVTLATWYLTLILTIALAFFISLGLLLSWVWLRKRLTQKTPIERLRLQFEDSLLSDSGRSRISYQVELNQRAIENCLESGIPLDDMTKEVNRLAAANNRLRQHLN